MGNRDDYYAQWYAENRARRNARRRKRWREDPAYRRRQVRKRPRRRKRSRDRQHLAPLELEAGGRVIVLWSVGVLAKWIGRTVRTVDSWQARGALPETPFRRGGVRYYSEGMIKAIQDALTRAGGRVRDDDALWYYRVLLQWLQGDLAHLEEHVDVEPKELRRVYQDGELVAYTVLGASEELGRQVQTVVDWQRCGLIPRTPLRYGEEEVFTPGMIRALSAAVQARGGVVPWQDATLRRELREAWRPEIKAYRRRMKGATWQARKNTR